MMLILLAVLAASIIPTALSVRGCEAGWNSGKDFCYKHFFNTNDLVNYDEAQSRCAKYDGWLAPVTNDGVLQMLAVTAKQAGNQWYAWQDHAFIGSQKNVQGKWVDGANKGWPFYAKFCPGGYQNWNYNCAILIVDTLYSKSTGKLEREAGPACIIPTDCSKKFSRYICMKKKTEQVVVVCSKPHSVNVNGKCQCADGYIDITETDLPERDHYQKGDKCIPKDPCREAKDLTVNFIVDSSQSIGSENWNSLVEFLRSGADFLPSTTRVGFIKYSTTVTFSQFLPGGWSRQAFRNFVPSAFDNGGTNTPLALSRAREMFDNDYNQNKVAILITDGMPFDENLTEDEVNENTIAAAKKLRARGVNLITLGYGESLSKKGHLFLRQLLEDPEEDYFNYDKMACDFKSLHMSILMRKVCRRFAKD